MVYFFLVHVLERNIETKRDKIERFAHLKVTKACIHVQFVHVRLLFYLVFH